MGFQEKLDKKQEQKEWISVQEFADKYRLNRITAWRILSNTCAGISEQWRNHRIEVRRNGRATGGYEVLVSSLPSSHDSSRGYSSPKSSLNNSSSSVVQFPVESKKSETRSAELSYHFNPFCDWLTVHQEYSYRLPALNAGCVVSVDGDVIDTSKGFFVIRQDNVDYLTRKFFKHDGSFDTSVQIRADGYRLSVSGNISRFGRPDNVWGFSVADCVKKLNRILAELELPELTAGEKMKNGEWSGAYFTRLDLTQNFGFSSYEESQFFLNWAISQKPFNSETKPYFGSGVTYGQGSRFISSKLYDKYLDYINHKSTKKRIDRGDMYSIQVMDYLKSIGCLRFEISLKSMYLKKNEIRYLGDIMKNDDKLVKIYNDRISKVVRLVDYEQIDNVSTSALKAYYAWKAGVNLKEIEKRRTFYAIRKELLQIGVDIAIPYNPDVLQFPVRIKSIQPVPVKPMEFCYESELEKDLQLIA